MSGTAAIGIALPNAAINIVCAQGSTSGATNANGGFQMTFTASTPCVITARSGNTLLHSEAFAGGTYNVTSETELLLVYLAAQLGTTEDLLTSGFTVNSTFQGALANPSVIQNAQAAVVQALEAQYQITLTAPNFLTTAFVVGQPGVDADLVLLHSVGAIDANGEPTSTAVSLMTTLGAQHPLTPPAASGTTGTTGTTGITGTTGTTGSTGTSSTGIGGGMGMGMM